MRNLYAWIAVCGLIVAIGVASVSSPVLGLSAGWDVTAGLLILVVSRTLSRGADVGGPGLTPGVLNRPIVVAHNAIVLGSLASLLLLGWLLVAAGHQQGAARDWYFGLGVITVILSWFLVHTSFSLYYARLYLTLLRESGDQTGMAPAIEFHQSRAPSTRDFAYVGFTVGMTYQVSDNDLQHSAMRLAVLRHALLSYMFGAVVIATLINLISNLAIRN